MIIAKRKDDLREQILEQRENGNAILWLMYPKRPDKSTGFPISAADIERTIAERKLIKV